MKSGVLFIAALLAALAPLQANAQRRYIDDQLEVTLRSGESTRHSILTMLVSGTPVQVLESNPDTGYTRIQTEGGKIGWVLSRFVVDQPAARDRLVQVRAQLDRLRAAKAAVDENLAQVEAQRQAIERERDELLSIRTDLDGQLQDIRSTAANSLAIAEDKRNLEARLEESEVRLRTTLAQNKVLADRSTQRWFIIGAGAVIAGALLGWILPRLRRRSRGRWGDL